MIQDPELLFAAGLSPRETAIYCYRQENPKATYRQMGDALGISRQAVHQQYINAKSKLFEHLYGKSNS